MPGPLVRSDTPGTDCNRELKSVRPRSWMSAPETAVRLIGVVCTVDSRFSAVTTTSSSCDESDWACCCASADGAHPRSDDVEQHSATQVNLFCCMMFCVSYGYWCGGRLVDD